MKICCRCKQSPRKKNSSYCRPCMADYRRERVNHRWAVLKRYKQMVGCRTCGFKGHFAALQFNHVDPSSKAKGGVARLLKSSGNWERVKEEVRKCEVLCSNCHAIHSYEEQHHMLGMEDN